LKPKVKNPFKKLSPHKIRKRILTSEQGNQIGRICAYLEIVFFGQFLENNKVDRIFILLFPHSHNYVSILTKKRLGYNLGDFFTNSSGHPASERN
jgi:hypothetical protein